MCEQKNADLIWFNFLSYQERSRRRADTMVHEMRNDHDAEVCWAAGILEVPYGTARRRIRTDPTIIIPSDLSDTTLWNDNEFFP